MGAPEFYDDYLSYQISSGINDRIYHLYQRLCKIGLNTNDNVLEIGCGIGTLTYLLAKKIKTGRIEALDISPKSVQFASRHVQQSNVHFSVGDVLAYKPGVIFNKILLFDVLEHIPLAQHNIVFKCIADWLKPDGLLLINLPNPEYILYEEKNNPKNLQELDQAVFLNELLPLFAMAGLTLTYFESYSVWVKNDYHFLCLKKQQPFTEIKLSTQYSLARRMIKRFQREWRKLLHPYPSKSRR